MESKEEIVKNWLPRYTGATLDQFGSYILLTNFDGYLQKFAEWHNVEIIGKGKAMPMATADGVTMINFSMGSANAATIMDLLSAIMPKAVLFLGISYSLLRPFAVKEQATTTSRLKSLPCRRLHCNALYHPPSATSVSITGQAQCTPPTAEFGNTMNNSKSTFVASARWP
jgi:hypothetical protein